MSKVVELNPPLSATEAMRRRFEAWASTPLRTDEASSILARSRGGEYVPGTARAAWASWQARGVVMAQSEGSLDHPRNRVLVLLEAAKAISMEAGTDPADGTMMLLTAAAKLARDYSGKNGEALIVEVLAGALGAATVAADNFFFNPKSKE